MASILSLDALPTEILQSIFLYLDPASFLAASQLCRDVRKVTAHEPVLWRHLCLSSYTYWDVRHQIKSKIASPLSSVDWRGLFIQRAQIASETRRLLDQLLGTQERRVARMNTIAELGYDAKEALLGEMRCPDDCEDVLARRYYATAVLERIHRDMAIVVWKELAEGKDVPLERSLAAYDLFTRAEEAVDLDRISQELDGLADLFRERHPGFEALLTREMALKLVSFLHDRGFNGVSEGKYRNLRNSFIGLALVSPQHESLPLVSVAIYCAIAHRLGLDARPMNYPGHIYCIVYAPQDYTLNGDYKPASSTAPDAMYLDPFRSTQEVLQTSLVSFLHTQRIPTDQHAQYLSHATTREITVRTARNLIASVHYWEHVFDPDIVNRPGQGRDWTKSYPDKGSCMYASIWALLLLNNVAIWSAERRHMLPNLLETFQTHYPCDIGMLEKHVIPLFAPESAEAVRLREFVRVMLDLDARPKTVQRRPNGPGAGREGGTAVDTVRYKVGQLFRHRRYGYEGVITGWDFSCDAGEEWIEQMSIDMLPNGRNQAFYHVL